MIESNRGQGDFVMIALRTRGPCLYSAALHEDCIIDCAEQPLSKVIGDLSKQHGIAICLDSPGFAAAGRSADMPVTIRIAQVSLKSALELLLSELNLNFAAAGDQLIVVPKGKAALDVKND